MSILKLVKATRNVFLLFGSLFIIYAALVFCIRIPNYMSEEKNSKTEIIQSERTMNSRDQIIDSSSVIKDGVIYTSATEVKDTLLSDQFKPESIFDKLNCSEDIKDMIKQGVYAFIVGISLLFIYKVLEWLLGNLLLQDITQELSSRS